MVKRFFRWYFIDMLGVETKEELREVIGGYFFTVIALVAFYVFYLVAWTIAPIFW